MPQRTDINLDEFRKLLLKQRAELLGLHQEQRADMLEEAGDVSDNDLTAASFDSEDAAAALADYDRDDALDVNVRNELREIDRALERISDGSYGICIVTGKPIPVERLRALPWATMTVEAAEQVVQ